MSDVSIEDQAALAIVFDENIRDLVRKHLKAALEDYGFLNGLYTFPLAEHMFRNISNSPAFQKAVKDAMIVQMNKY